MDQFGSAYWRRRVSRRTVFRGAALTGAGLAGAALIGCGEDTAEEPSAPTTAPGGGGGGGGGAATSAPTGEAQGAVKTGGRLQLHQAGDPPSFDLHQESTTYTNLVTTPAYNQLVQFDPMAVDEPPDSIIGDLATEWEVSPDGTTYTFHLVQNATYHGGQPFVAQDVVASYERQKNPPEDLINPPRGSQIPWIETMETPDDHTLVINTARPISVLSVLPIFAQGWMAIYSHEVIDAGYDKRELPNGTGPFIMKSYDQGVKVVYDRNPDFWQEGLPYLDGIDIYVIPDVSTAIANFQGGQLHVFGPNRQDFESLKQSMGDQIEVQDGIKSLGFDCINFGGREPWTDQRVRHAVTLAHNKQTAIDVIDLGDGRLGGYMNPGGYWAISQEELEQIPGYEPFTDQTIAEARKLLDAAGVPATMDATILTRQGASYEPYSLYVQDQMAKIGINCTLDIQETASAYDILAKREFDLAPWVHGYALDDPDALWAEFYLTGGPRNYSQISTPEIDDIYLKQSMEQDVETRRELVKELQKVSIPQYGKMVTSHGFGRAVRWNYVENYVTHVTGYNNGRRETVWLDV